MNKETRIFILGIMLILICSTGLSLQVIEIMEGTFSGAWDWFILISCVYGSVSGVIKINKTT